MLANAAAGTASTIELQTLSFLIQSLPGHAAPVASTPMQATSTNFQLVLQYSESPSERWIIPRGPAIYEKDTAGDDFTLTFAIPLQGGSTAQDDFTAVPTLNTSAAQVVTMDFKKPPTTLSDTISRWIVGSERENRMRITKLKEQSKRNYLVYRVAPKDIIANLQQASGIDYTMTSIKPGSRPVAPPSPPKPKRKPGRKPKADTQSISAPAPTAVYSPPPVAGPSTSASIITTRRQKSAMALPHCVTCKKTEVALVLGGRFCRACVDAGRAAVVQVTQSGKGDNDTLHGQNNERQILS
uniref:Uncharacterized protein n=1 Tax=Mycena chlorophos TaxID=658473 RepID=A0ABQ0LBG2_MYCCL|nr:predicted protein [Mycena chlorophos]